MKNNLKKYFLFLIATINFIPFIGIAGFGEPTTNPPTNIDPSFFNKIYVFSIFGGAALAFIMIVIGGIQYTVSEALNTKQDAKDRIYQALIGLLLLLSAWLILNTINPGLVDLGVILPK